MGKRYDHLTAEDRRLIARLRDDGIPVTVIALQLGRHKSTIHRELRRNRTDDGPWLRGYFNATQRYLEQHGKPVAFYTDKHAVFRVNKPAWLHGDGMTQFGRALKALTSRSSAPTPARPRAASSAPTRPCRTGW